MIVILVTFFLLIQYSCSQSNVLNTTAAEIGKCDQIVGEFLLELMMDNESQKTVYMADKVLTCYESLKGESAKKLQTSYQFRYDKYEYYNHDTDYCTEFLLRDVDYLTDKCPEYAGYRNENITEKRRALNISKPCILKTMTSYCTPQTLAYMDSNYEKVVDYLTIVPENDNCESVQIDLIRGITQYKRASIMSRWVIFRDHVRKYNQIPNVASFNAHCSDLPKYSRNKCNIFSTDEAMKKCEVYKAMDTEFYTCANRYGKLHPVNMDNCEPKNRTCIQQRMARYCGKPSVIDFDINFEWFNKHDVKKPDSIKLDDNDFTEYLQPKLENPISIDSEVGKCAPIADELVSILSRKNSFRREKNFRIENNLCTQILECYDTTNSATLKDLYSRVCDKLKFKTGYVFLFLESFYLDLRRQNKTIDNSDYFSKNLTLKRNAFVKGKAEILDISNNKYGLGSYYLNNKYDHFVGLITTKPENDTYCNSIYSTAETYPCTPIINNMAESLNVSSNWDSSLAVFILEECGYAEKCLNGIMCPTEESKKIINWCVFAKHGNVYFLSCLEKLHKEEPNFPNDHCAKKIAKKSETGGAYMELFGKDKKCLENVMLDKCGEDAARGFDSNYINVEENMNRKKEK